MEHKNISSTIWLSNSVQKQALDIYKINLYLQNVFVFNKYLHRHGTVNNKQIKVFQSNVLVHPVIITFYITLTAIGKVYTLWC